MVRSISRITNQESFPRHLVLLISLLVIFIAAPFFVYSVIEEFQPGSFTSTSPDVPHDLVGRVMQMRYFGFVTLATVGYGDIVPHTLTARTMALLEAMLGQFYLVALIGRLVGLHIVHGNPERKS